MSLLRGPGRGRAFLRFLLGIAWLVVAYYLSYIAAHGFSRGAAFPLIRNLFTIFMLIVGYGYMAMTWDRSPDPFRAMGLASRSGRAREFAMGAALGWGMVTVVILISSLGGTFYVQIVTSPSAWALLAWQILALAAGALAGEIAFRGYPFQKLIETTGPFAATILAGIFFGLIRWETPGATPTAVWISALAAILLSVAYLRTHALWLCWGLHFAWVASIGILFGQPLAGSRHASSVIYTYVDGPAWLTGGEFGPEASMVSLIALWIGLYILIWITRDLAWKYGQPELKPAGIPVELGHPLHPAPPQAASAPLQEAPKNGLVQIAPMSAIAGSAPKNSEPQAPSSPPAEPSNGDTEQEPENLGNP